jgi:hypothetical protein
VGKRFRLSGSTIARRRPSRPAALSTPLVVFERWFSCMPVIVCEPIGTPVMTHAPVASVTARYDVPAMYATEPPCVVAFSSVSKPENVPVGTRWMSTSVVSAVVVAGTSTCTLPPR